MAKKKEVATKKEVKKQQPKTIRIKNNAYDCELNARFSPWVSTVDHVVLEEKKDCFIFGNAQGIKLGAVKKEDCEVK